MSAQPSQTYDVDSMISASVDGIRAFRRMKVTALYAALGLSRTAYYDRLSGETKWSAAEVKRAADALGVSVATLYDGLLPHLDSNQKPIGLLAPVVDLFTRETLEIAA